MAILVTPRQLILRGQFYQQLSQLTAAGIPIIQALDMLSRNPPSRSFREPIREILAQLSKCATVAEAMRHLGHWVPSFDLALIEAGEKSGRLDAVFRMLAGYYEDRAALLRQMLSDLAYPAFLFHFAVFLFPFLDWFKGGVSLWMFGLKTIGVLIPLYAIILLTIFAAQGRRGMKWRTLFEQVLRPVPVLGSARHSLALSRLSSSLEALINAGVSIIEAWEMAAAASGSPAIYRVVVAWRPHVTSGQTPSEAVNAARVQFPELFANLYHSGEVSGQLDESLRRLHKYYQDDGTHKLRLLAQWVPKFFYFGVAALVGYKVITFYTGYFDQLKQIMK